MDKRNRIIIAEPGIHENIPAEDYHAHMALSRSYLCKLLRSPAHALVETEETPAMRFGSLVHTCVLEPGEQLKRYAKAPVCDRRTTKGKAIYAEWTAENSGKIVVSEQDWETAINISAAIHNHPDAAELLSEGRPEVTAICKDISGPLRKARIDWDRSDIGALIDLKTTSDASPAAFARSAANYQYHIQAAYYLDTWREAGGDAETFWFIAVEKTPPFGIAVYELPANAIEDGRRLYREAIARHNVCQDSGEWPAYEPGIKQLVWPAWA